MITYRKAKKLLNPGDIIYSIGAYGGVVKATIWEICDGWLETDFGIMDFDDHRTTWWLTERCAVEICESKK